MDLKENDFRENEKLYTESNTSSPSPAPKKHTGKAQRILEACKKRNITDLRELATSEGGLISDDFRRKAWPILLGMSEDASEFQDSLGWGNLPVHPDEDQVKLDVNRSFIYYPHDLSSSDLLRRKEELSDLITEVLRRLPYLSYFQGYHDICQVFMLVLNPEVRAPVVARLSALRIRDFMLPTFSHALDQLNLIPCILYTVNPQLWIHLSSTQPFFALSGTLTMYAHDIQEYGVIARVFDVLLAREAVFSVYMFAQIVLQRSDELFQTPADEPEILHSILSKLPKSLSIDTVISDTVRLFELHPPENFKAWRSISRNSVLKTTRWPDQAIKQSLENGSEYFKNQVKELKWAEQRENTLKLLWNYRKPVAGIGISLLVGLFSIWLSKSYGTTDIVRRGWRYIL